MLKFHSTGMIKIQITATSTEGTVKQIQEAIGGEITNAGENILLK